MISPEYSPWPGDFRAAVSLSFDDARYSQPDALPILDSHDVKASFYVSLENIRPKLDQWRRCAAAGHEMGNHSLTHPCSANFPFARHNPLEDFTLEKMERDLLGANDAIEQLFGTRPTTYAYPCGQKFVGRGQTTQSYVPLVSRHFLIGRGYNDQFPNDPLYCDPAQVYAVDFDGVGFAQIESLLEMTVRQGGWLVLAGHEVGNVGPQTVRADVLEQVCRHCRNSKNQIWIDRVDRIGQHVIAMQQAQATRR